MVTDIFEGLLLELGKIYDLKLQPDKNQSCLIKMKGGIQVQIEVDHTGAGLIIGCDLGAVPQGKYRENLFLEALKANGMPSPRYGTLAFSRNADRLILFDNLTLKDLNGDKIATYLTPFAAKAKIWADALTRGEIPVISAPGQSQGMFGLK